MTIIINVSSLIILLKTLHSQSALKLIIFKHFTNFELNFKYFVTIKSLNLIPFLATFKLILYDKRLIHLIKIQFFLCLRVFSFLHYQ